MFCVRGSSLFCGAATLETNTANAQFCKKTKQKTQKQSIRHGKDRKVLKACICFCPTGWPWGPTDEAWVPQIRLLRSFHCRQRSHLSSADAISVNNVTEACKIQTEEEFKLSKQAPQKTSSLGVLTYGISKNKILFICWKTKHDLAEQNQRFIQK